MLLPRVPSPTSSFSFPALRMRRGCAQGRAGSWTRRRPRSTRSASPPRCLVFSRAPFLPRCLFLFPPCGGVEHRDEQAQGRTAAPGRGAAAVAAASRSPQGAGSTLLAGVPPCKSSSLVCGCGGGLTMARAAGFTINTTSSALTGCYTTLFGGRQLWWADAHHRPGPRSWRRYIQSR